METGIKRESMVFYDSFFEAIKDLPAEQFKDCACAILGYGLKGEIPETSGVEKSVFILVKPQIDKNNQRWNNAKKGKETATVEVKKEEKVSQIKEMPAAKPKVENHVEEVASFVVDDEDDDEISFDDYEDTFSACENDEVLSLNDVPEKCGEFSNVLLSPNDREKLIKRFGVREYQARLDFFSMYLKKKPQHKSACHYVDLCDWVGKAVEERRGNDKKSNSSLPNFDFEDFFEKP